MGEEDRKRKREWGGGETYGDWGNSLQGFGRGIDASGNKYW